MSGTHPTRLEDFDLYALGALDADEKVLIEAHVASCPDCAQKVAEAQGRMALLAFAAPRVEPSPGVKEVLMRRLHSTAEGPGGSVPAPARSPEPPGGIFGRWWAVLLPLSGALALATILLWLHNVQLDRQLADLRSTVVAQQKQLDDSHHMADLLAARDTIVVKLWEQKTPTAVGARVVYNSREGMLMYDGVLPPAPADKVYQIWLVPMKGAPISAGWFTGRPDRPGRMMMKLPAGLDAKEFAVSLEPAGGMPQPTGPMVLIGPVS
ncbi:MAG: anti-sigma factor [Candidatus Acidiferrales bacterium]